MCSKQINNINYKQVIIIKIFTRYYFEPIEIPESACPALSVTKCGIKSTNLKIAMQCLQLDDLGWVSIPRDLQGLARDAQVVSSQN